MDESWVSWNARKEMILEFAMLIIAYFGIYFKISQGKNDK
jgi:hypothetical protein